MGNRSRDSLKINLTISINPPPTSKRLDSVIDSIKALRIGKIDIKIRPIVYNSPASIREPSIFSISIVNYILDRKRRILGFIESIRSRIERKQRKHRGKAGEFQCDGLDSVGIFSFNLAYNSSINKQSVRISIRKDRNFPKITRGICRSLKRLIKHGCSLPLTSVDLMRKRKVLDNLHSFKVPLECSIKLIDLNLKRFYHTTRNLRAKRQ